MLGGMKKLVNTFDIHEAFLEYISDKIKTQHRLLEQAVKIEDVYRIQGQITALRRLSGIRDEINSLDK